VNSTSKSMKRDMLKAAEMRLSRLFPGLTKAKRAAMARTGVDMFVARVRRDVKEGKAYVEADHSRTERTTV
jgi:hypothetical protein